MKQQFKHLAALAVLAATAGAVHAQSSVTISGLLNVGIARGNNGQTQLDGTSANGKFAMNDLLSNFALSGKEDLGDGMWAGFQLVSFFQVDNGALFQNDSFFSSRSVLRLGGRFGEVYMGRSLTPANFQILFYDPWGWNASSAQVGWQIQTANYKSTSYLRTNNTVGYVSPELHGFTLSLAHSTGENVVSNDDGAALDYKNGALSLGIGYDQSHGMNNSPTKDHMADVVAAYDFGFIKPMATYTTSKVNNVSYRAYSLAATAPVGVQGTLKAAYGRLNDCACVAGERAALSKVSLGYQHDLSKRTALFANLSRAKARTLSATNTVELGIQHGF
ncbi:MULTISPECIES: porin [unclassified Herbaspirillum]|uniref:porin n=1 Tax=unclassified Herbaspirillum TaxID=2624150 RepID=UPI001150E139|nr:MULTISPECIES: porin [unclassified Herbaspirillum]MBB5391321.1 putative porin [Herbaspirillum sp. SJZ102]TQK12992.1 putative porin [Herbaspirillum sp. SJZ130]TQK14996.1 putative porin [Herbaspirillum sp. SJZ106]TWC67352.1 putative porin [Herbaspirillum sp. SJZ099]